MKLLKYIIILSIICFLILFLSFSLFVKKEDISKYIYNQTGKEIHFDKYGITFYPTLALSLSNVKFVDRINSKINAKKLLISFSYDKIDSINKLKIKNLYLIKPNIILSKNKEPSNNSKNIDIENIYLKDAKITYDSEIIENVNVNASLEKSILNIDKLTIKEWSSIKDIEISGKINLVNEKYYDMKTTVDYLDIDNYIDFDDKKSKKSTDNSSLTNFLDFLNEFNHYGNVEIKNLKVKEYLIKGVNFELKAKNGLINIDPIEFNIYGGKLKGEYSIDVKNNKPKYIVKQQIVNLSLSKLLDMDEKVINGTANMYLDIKFSGTNKKQIIKSMKGIKKIYGKNTILNKYDIDEIVSLYENANQVSLLDIGAMLTIGPFAGILTQGAKIVALNSQINTKGSTKIEEFTSFWKIKNSKATTNDVAFKTKNNIIVLNGSVDLGTKKYKDMKVAILNKKMCAKYIETIFGNLDTNDVNMKKEGAEIFISPITSLVESANELLEGCNVYYNGRIKW